MNPLDYHILGYLRDSATFAFVSVFKFNFIVVAHRDWWQLWQFFIGALSPALPDGAMSAGTIEYPCSGMA